MDVWIGWIDGWMNGFGGLPPRDPCRYIDACDAVRGDGTY